MIIIMVKRMTMNMTANMKVIKQCRVMLIITNMILMTMALTTTISMATLVSMEQVTTISTRSLFAAWSGSKWSSWPDSL